MPDSGYDTDLSNEQWAMVEEFIPPPKPGGRPRTTDMRRVFDACLYAVKTGCQWRQLPRDFRRTCYGYFVDWGSLINKQGIFRRLHRRLYFQARKAADRKPYPSVVIVDSQTVRTGKMGGVRGYDGGKHIKGRKRHTAVDTLGLPMAVTITAPMFMTSMVDAPVLGWAVLGLGYGQHVLILISAIAAVDLGLIWYYNTKLREMLEKYACLKRPAQKLISQTGYS